MSDDFVWCDQRWATHRCTEHLPDHEIHKCCCGIEMALADLNALAEQGRQRAGRREDLIAQGIDPRELEVPIHYADHPDYREWRP